MPPGPSWDAGTSISALGETRIWLTDGDSARVEADTGTLAVDAIYPIGGSPLGPLLFGAELPRSGEPEGAVLIFTAGGGTWTAFSDVGTFGGPFEGAVVGERGLLVIACSEELGLEASQCGWWMGSRAAG